MNLSESYKAGHEWAGHRTEMDPHHINLGVSPEHNRHDFELGYENRVKANKQSNDDYLQNARADARIHATNLWDEHRSLHPGNLIRTPYRYASETDAPSEWRHDIESEYREARQNHLDAIGARLNAEHADRGIRYNAYSGTFNVGERVFYNFPEAEEHARRPQMIDPDRGRPITNSFRHEYTHPIFGRFKVNGFSDGTLIFDDGAGDTSWVPRSLPHANWVNENVVRSLQRHISENDPPAIHFSAVDTKEHPGRARGYLQMLLHPQSPLVKAGYTGFVHPSRRGGEATFLAVKPEHADKVPSRFEPASLEHLNLWPKERKVKMSKTPETIPVSVTPYSLTPDDRGHFATGHIGDFRCTVHRPKDTDRFTIQLKHKDGSISHPSPSYQNVRTLLDAHKAKRSDGKLEEMHSRYKPVRLSRFATPSTLLINLNGKRVGTVILPASGPPSFFGGAQFLFSTIPSYLLDSGNGMYTVPGLGVITIQRLA